MRAARDQAVQHTPRWVGGCLRGISSNFMWWIGRSCFPGSTCGKISRDQCVSNIAAEINSGLRATKGVKVVLENMSGQGGTIGGDFRELKQIIDKVTDKRRIGVCIDTCHAMAQGKLVVHRSLGPGKETMLFKILHFKAMSCDL